MKKLSMLALVVLSLALIVPAMAQQNGSTANRTPVASGAKMKAKGMIIKRDQGSLIVRDQAGSELTVKLAGNAKIEEKKSNPFRGSKRYSESQLVRGLYVEVEGHGDSSGARVAEKIKLADDDFRVAQAVESTVVPVENRLAEAEDRVTCTEQNAQRLGQLDELAQVANLAKGGAAAAQETADVAVDGVNKTNDRISSLDDFEVKKSETINFKVGSAVLNTDAKSMLDSIATQAKAEKGFVIEVRGFASADGAENSNRVLSQRRAEVDAPSG
jgi:outer membrane protein OmpA-like peptidoglycan-associated protein